jgi:HPr kinase/phosphorylase
MSFDTTIENPQISVADFVENAPADLAVEVLAGANGLRKRQIVSTRIQKLGLALAGFAHYIHAGRVQIVGQSEISYLLQLERSHRIEAINNLDLDKISCILITKELEPPPELKLIAEEKNLPILRTRQVSSITISLVSGFLQETLAPQITRHGVFNGNLRARYFNHRRIWYWKVRMRSGFNCPRASPNIGRPDYYKKIGDKLVGSSPDLTREHLEIRGLGIINIRDLFGVSAVGKPKPIELLLNLKDGQKPSRSND